MRSLSLAIIVLAVLSQSTYARPAGEGLAEDGVTGGGVAEGSMTGGLAESDPFVPLGSAARTFNPITDIFGSEGGFEFGGDKASTGNPGRDEGLATGLVTAAPVQIVNDAIAGTLEMAGL
jgi:hypothetical protein